MRRGWLIASVSLLACKPEPAGATWPPPEGADVLVSSEPTLVVERQGEGVVCDLVGLEEQTFDVREHTDWLDLWLDNDFDSEFEDPPATAIEARTRACALSEGLDESLRCTERGRQVLAIPVEFEVAILVVEDRGGGLRSIELSRWAQMCRCSCGSRVQLLGREPLRVVVAEYESVAAEVHSEGDEIVEGCDEDDECMSACMGEIYGRQRVLTFGDSLDIHDAFFDDSVREGGEFGVRFELDAGRLVANGTCTQVLSE